MIKRFISCAILAGVLFISMGCTTNKRKILTLSEAFNQKLLTASDLETIAYYHNDDSMPVYPESLNEKIEKKIKRDFLKAVNSSDTEENVSVVYYGTYNNCVVALITYKDLGKFAVSPTETVSESTFYYVDNQRIFVWKEK